MPCPSNRARLLTAWLPSSTTAVLLCCMLFVVFSPELSYAEEEEYPQLPGMPGNETWPAPYVESGQGLGVFSCPCIDTKNYTAPYVKPKGPCGKRLDFTNDPHTGCLDTNYGSGSCRAWDTKSTEICVNSKLNHGEKPAWCGMKWCFVDPEKCGMPKEQSTTFPALAYSYGTCGEMISPWVTANAIRKIKGRTLRVGVPIFEVPWIYKSARNNELIGRVPSIMGSLATLYGFKVEYRSISDLSRKDHPDSSWSACVQDTAIGYLDVCYGNFWDTTERRKFAYMGPPIAETPLFMYTKLSKKRTFGEDIMKPLSPFHGDTWWLILFVTIFVAGFDAFLESGLCTDAVDQGHHAWHEPMSTLQQLKVQTFLKMSRMFSQASPAEDYNVTKMKLESMLVVIGYGLFVTIVTTMYTANLASLLVNEKISSNIKSLDQAIKLDLKICVSTGVEGDMEAAYPALSAPGAYRAVSEYPMIEALDKYGCEVGIMAVDEAFNGQSGAKLCEWQPVGEKVMTVMNSLPFSDKYNRVLSYALAMAKSKGYIAQAMRVFPFKDSCSAFVASEDFSGQVKPSHLIGALVLMCVFFLAAFAVRLGKNDNVDDMKTLLAERKARKSGLTSPLVHPTRDDEQHNGTVASLEAVDENPLTASTQEPSGPPPTF